MLLLYPSIVLDIFLGAIWNRNPEKKGVFSIRYYFLLSPPNSEEIKGQKEKEIKRGEEEKGAAILDSTTKNTYAFVRVVNIGIIYMHRSAGPEVHSCFFSNSVT